MDGTCWIWPAHVFVEHLIIHDVVAQCSAIPPIVFQKSLNASPRLGSAISLLALLMSRASKWIIQNLAQTVVLKQVSYALLFDDARKRLRPEPACKQNVENIINSYLIRMQILLLRRFLRQSFAVCGWLKFWLGFARLWRCRPEVSLLAAGFLQARARRGKMLRTTQWALSNYRSQL